MSTAQGLALLRVLKSHQPNGKAMYEVPQIRTSREPEYPSAWFAAHPREKPHLSITLISQDLDSIRGVTRKRIGEHEVTKEEAITFIFHFAKNVVAKLDEKWESYGVLIGDRGALVTPLDLLCIKATLDIEPQCAANVDKMEDEDRWMMVYLLGEYRLLHVTDESYRADIIKKISSEMRAMGSTVLEITDKHYGNRWANRKEFKILIAAFDMFFNRFPDHKYAKMRIGTMGSRFFGCGALTSCDYMMNLLGMTNRTDLFKWAIFKEIVDDINRMMKADEEFEKPYSYFPYQLDMCLVLKSAYSVQENRRFFTWIHLTGCLLHSKRSLHAKKLNFLVNSLLFNASFMAYAFSHESEKGGEVDEEHKVGLIEQTLKSRDPKLWSLMLQKTNNKMPIKVKKWVKDVILQFERTRNGTLGAYLAGMVDTL